MLAAPACVPRVRNCAQTKEITVMRSVHQALCPHAECAPQVRDHARHDVEAAP